MKPTKAEFQHKLESYCSYQERCLSDVMNKFSTLCVPLEWQNDIVQHLQTLGYLDEKRFAESYVSGKFRLKKWGKRKIFVGLRSKGISNELIQNAFKEIDSETYWETLLSLASKKSQELMLSSDPSWHKKAQLTRFLIQRGYESDLISDALESILRK